MKTRILALVLCMMVFIASCAASVADIIINPSEDGSIYDNQSVNSSFLLVSTNIRGVVEFPISAIDGQIQNATLSVNPHGLPLHAPVIKVYGYLSDDGILTSSDYDAGAFLGDWLLPDLQYGQDAYFDVTEFLKTVTTPYVGFNLRSTDGTDSFCSIESNYGHPSQLSIVIPEPAMLFLFGLGGLIIIKEKSKV